ncbi:MAG: hypothetical protein E3J47_08150 [Candidatus Stahlbacteria bacterium]|nr:MAG: hypothetical protein E3J47_08150 [Candidatus Stahlbacteria bacterium]
MKRIILFVLIIVTFFISSSNAFNMRFENTTDKTLIYEFLWLESDWEVGKHQVASVAMGELQAGDSNTLIADFKPGPYVIVWKNLSSSKETFYKSYLFRVEQKRCMVVSTPWLEPLITLQKD